MAEKTVKIEYKGKQIEVPASKVDTMLAQALEYEEVKGELEVSQKGLKEYRQFEEYLRSNPRVAEAVQVAFRDPDRFLGGGTPQGRGDDNEPDLDLEEADDATKALAKKLQRQEKLLNERLAKVDAMEARLREVDVQGERRTLEQRIDAALGEYSWLKGSSLEMVKDQVATAMAKGPSQPLAAVVGAQVGLFKKAVSEHQKEIVKKADEKESLETTREREGTPTAATDKKFSKDDLANGNLLKESLAIANRWAGDITRKATKVPGIGLQRDFEE